MRVTALKSDQKILQKARDHTKRIARALLAELVGTFALTFVAAGAEVFAKLTGGEVDHISRVVAPGLLVMALIYALGDVSGAHLNPAVTLAFAVRRDFPWRFVPGYWLVQLAGAVLAAGLLKLLFGSAANAGNPPIQATVGVALVIEIILTGLLVTVILGTSTRHQVIGTQAAIAVGATISLCGLFASPISGASMNPARSFGPALWIGSFDPAWIYLVGPLAGSLLAVGFTNLLHDRNKPGEIAAATGESDEQKRPKNNKDNKAS